MTLDALLASAQDGLTWWFNQLAAEAKAPLVVEQVLQKDVAPMLARLGPAARDRYIHLLSDLFVVSVPAVRAAVSSVPSSNKKIKKKQEASEHDYDDCRVGDVVLTRQGTAIIKMSRDSGKYPNLIFTGQVTVAKRVLLPGEGEVLTGKVVCPESNVERELELPQAAWETRAALKRHMPTAEFAWFGTENEVQSFMLHLSRSCPKVVLGTRLLGLSRFAGEWALALDDKTLLPGGRETSELIHYSGGGTGAAWVTKEVEKPTREDFEQFCLNAFEFSSLGKAAGIIGWMGAVAFKARLAFLLTKKFPFLLLWGPRGSGKSSVAAELLLRFYSSGQSAYSTINQLTRFTAVLSSAVTNLIPFVIDEYKGWSFLDSFQRLLLSETIRNCFDCVAARRGNKDAASQRIYPAVAPLVVCGEDTILEPAAQERMIEIFLGPKDKEGKEPTWKALLSANLGGLGLDYLSWSLNVDDADVLDIFRKIEADLEPRFKGRIRHNIAIASFGLQMVAQWLGDRGVAYPVEAMAEHVSGLVKVQADARYTTASASKPPSIVDRMLEALAMAAERNVIARGFDFDLAEEEADGNFGLLYLRLNRIFPVFKKWAAETRYEEEVLSLGAFRRQVDQEPYFIESNATKYFLSSGRRVKCVVFNLSMMLAMGLDVDGFTSGRDYKEQHFNPSGGETDD